MRNYRKEYVDYYGASAETATPLQKKHRKEKASRNKARRLLKEEHRVSKHDGKDIDHIDHNPLNNSKSNLRVISKSKNRADN